MIDQKHPMNYEKSYISVDEHGVRRVAETRISLDSVVIAFQQGQSAEEIQRNFPALSLEQVYGAITYYLGHRREVEDYLSEQEVVWEQARRENERAPAGPAVERLRKVRAQGTGQVQ